MDNNNVANDNDEEMVDVLDFTFDINFISSALTAQSQIEGLISDNEYVVVVDMDFDGELFTAQAIKQTMVTN